MALEMQGLKASVGELPGSITAAIPAAVRAHDENEQVLARKAVESSRVGGVMAAIDRAPSMADLARIEGITWDATQNFLKCDDCFRSRERLIRTSKPTKPQPNPMLTLPVLTPHPDQPFAVLHRT